MHARLHSRLACRPLRTVEAPGYNFGEKLEAALLLQRGWCALQWNTFGIVLEKIASDIGANYRHDGFDASVMEVRRCCNSIYGMINNFLSLFSDT
jgi:hypothetical protein